MRACQKQSLSLQTELKHSAAFSVALYFLGYSSESRLHSGVVFAKETFSETAVVGKREHT